MTVQECYEAMGGNYSEALRRLLDDARIKKYLAKFMADKSFGELCAAMDAKDYEAAFKSVHNLKGVSANMSLTGLQVPSEKLTEELRFGQPSDAVGEIYEQVKENYAKIEAAVAELLQ